jgi:hypothetical protein
MPTYFRDADIDLIMADGKAEGLAVDVSINGGSTIPGIVDYVGRDVLQSMNVAGISGVSIAVWVQTSKLTLPLRNRTPLTVEGQNMILRDSNPEGDGALTVLACERAP